MEKVSQLQVLRLQQKKTLKMKEGLQRTKHYRPAPADKPSQLGSIADTNPGTHSCDGSGRHGHGGATRHQLAH